MSIAVDIAREYLRNGSEPQKRNAVVALRALAGSDALKALIDVALDTSNRPLAEHAREQLSELSETDIATVAESLQQQLDSPGGDSYGVYDLLADLKSPKQFLHREKEALPKRLRMAWGLKASIFEHRRVPWYRKLLAGFVGSLLGILLVFVYLALAGVELRDGEVFLFVALIGVPIASLGPILRCLPVARYPDPVAGYIVEVVVGLVWALPLVAAMTVIALFDSMATSMTAGVAALLAAGTVPVVRWGTIVGHRIAPGLWGDSIACLVGALYGVGYVLALGYVAATWAVDSEFSLGFIEAVKAFLAVSLPWCVALGVAYAYGDRIGHRRPWSYDAQALKVRAVAAAPAGLTFLVLVMGVGIEREAFVAGDPISWAKGDTERTFEVAQVPFVVRVQVELPLRLSAELVHDRSQDYVLELYKQPDYWRRAVWDDPERVEGYSLESGAYDLRVAYYDSGYGSGPASVSFEGIFDFFFERSQRSYFERGFADATLDIRLAPDSDVQSQSER